MALGRTDEALAGTDQAIAQNGNAPGHHSDRGLVLKELKRIDEAQASFERALALDPRHLPALVNLAGILLAREKTVEALPLVRRALAVQESEETRNLFVAYLRALTPLSFAGDIGDLLLRAITEPWARPREFANMAANLVVSDTALGPIVARANAAWPRRLPAAELYGPGGLATAAKHALLRSLLESAPVSEVQLERFLTTARSAMLTAAATAGPAAAPLEPDVLAFYSALAQQCFINEYVFTVTPDELGRARTLLGMLDGALASSAAVPEIWPVIVGAYFSLNTVPGCKVMLGKSWPEPVRVLLRQQVAEPGEEQLLRSSIPKLTEIEDRVSQAVRQQYEENPYPRWVRAAPAPNPKTLAARLRELFPLAPLRPRGGTDGLDVLIAGCGTGQQPIEDARAYAGARLLAIDLSLASLAYAKRNTDALELRNIEYAQADILKLGSIGRTFDYIAASGVLHHAADPLAAWRTLLSLLRPGGCMVLGFYSETARRHVVAAQKYLAERDFRPTLSDIRRGRQEILSLPDGASPKNVTGIGRFFHRERVPRPAVSRAGEALHAAANRGLPRRERSGISRLLDPARRAAAIRASFPRRQGQDRPRALAPVRAGKPRHLHRHVPVLGAKALIAALARRCSSLPMMSFMARPPVNRAHPLSPCG